MKKIKILKKWKRCLEILSLYTCVLQMTYHMMYGSWNIKHDIHNFLSIWAVFCPFTPLKTWKIRILKKQKKYQEISSFYTCVPQMTIIWCVAPEMCSATDKLLLFWTTFFPFTPYKLQKSKFWKNEKKMPGDIIILHMWTTNENHMIHGS